MYNMSANNSKNTKNTKSTTIRIDQNTKITLENLDFVKKDTFDSIINKLIEFYEKNKKKVNSEFMGVKK
jgi:hypothetical protein